MHEFSKPTFSIWSGHKYHLSSRVISSVIGIGDSGCGLFMSKLDSPVSCSLSDLVVLTHFNGSNLVPLLSSISYSNFFRII